MFSLNWFKSKKQREKELDEKIELIDSMLQNRVKCGYEKPYKSVKMVNDVLTVVFNDGSVLTKTGATREDFEDVRNSIDESEVLDIIEDDAIANERRTAAKVIAIESIVNCHMPSAPHASKSETDKSAVRHWLVA